MTNPLVVLLLSFVGGGGGVATWLGALQVWRQRKSDNTNAAATRLQADRDTLDKRIAENVAGLDSRINALTGQLTALWEAVYEYRNRDLVWLAEREKQARKLIQAGIAVDDLPDELKHPVVVRATAAAPAAAATP